MFAVDAHERQIAHDTRRLTRANVMCPLTDDVTYVVLLLYQSHMRRSLAFFVGDFGDFARNVNSFAPNFKNVC